MLLLPLVLLLGLSWPRPGPHPTTHIAHSPQKPLSLSPPPYWSQCHQLAHLRPRRPVTSCPATAPVSPRSLCCCLLLLLPASCFLPPAACCLLPAACCLLLFCSWDFLSSQYLPAFFFSCMWRACFACLLFSSSSLPNAVRQQGTRTHAGRAPRNKSAAGIGDIEPRSASKRELGAVTSHFTSRNRGQWASNAISERRSRASNAISERRSRASNRGATTTSTRRPAFGWRSEAEEMGCEGRNRRNRRYGTHWYPY